MAQEPDLHELVKRIEQIERKLGIFYPDSHEDEWLESLMTSLDGRTLQQVFREIDSKDLALAIVGFKADTLQIVKNNLSKKGWEMLKDDMVYHTKWSGSGQSHHIAKLKIMSVIKQLEEMGEIVVVRGNHPMFENKVSFEIKDWFKNLEDERNKRIKIMEAWKKEVFDPLGD